MKHSNIYLPLKLLQEANQKYPMAWEQIDLCRKDRNKLGDWADWCYIPMAATASIVKIVNENNRYDYIENWIAILAALAPWRLSKEVFKFDENIEEILYKQADDIEIPVEILFSLPYYCIYIECNNFNIGNNQLHGFFVHLEHDVKNEDKELRFVFITKDYHIIPVPLHLGVGTIRDGIEKTRLQEIELAKKCQDFKVINSLNKSEFCEFVLKNISKAVQLVLYICAENSEISENPTQKNIYRTTDKIKDKYSEIRMWDVGTRIGSKIRSVKNISSFCDKSNDISQKKCYKNHHSPRPHTRRGHWHHFWIGSIKENKRKLILRWIAPTFINFSEDTPIVTHDIK